jgi:hypothetical protein
MRKIFAVLAVAALGLAQAGAAVGQADAGVRARELAASFSKSKHAVKEKRGVRVEKFKEVRSEPAARADAREYSGAYEADAGYTLSLRVGADGVAEASGEEPGEGGPRKFTLKGARVSGALLTGTKVYDDGSAEKFEGVFINRTDRDSPTAAGVTAFGLGVLFDPPKVREGHTMSRLFYRPK